MLGTLSHSLLITYSGGGQLPCCKTTGGVASVSKLGSQSSEACQLPQELLRQQILPWLSHEMIAALTSTLTVAFWKTPKLQSLTDTTLRLLTH